MAKVCRTETLMSTRTSTEDKLYGGINNLRLTASLFLGFFFTDIQIFMLPNEGVQRRNV